MKIRSRVVLKICGFLLGAALLAALAAPYLNADRYGERLRVSLERALGGKRRVELGKVRFSLFRGPRLTVDGVTIYEDPAFGAEPIVYIQDQGSLEVAPRLLSLLGGKFVISSIRLDRASINLAKSGPASEWGRWNFASVVDRSIMSAAPAIHVRNSRINFKYGDVKSVYYLTETDLDITPPPSGGSGWKVGCAAKPARTDRRALGLGSFSLAGRWFVAPERVDVDLEFDPTGLGEVSALISGQAGGIHGTVSGKMHLAGPIDNIGIAGRMMIEDVHRWEMLPQHGPGWPLEVGGKLNLVGQQLELQSRSASGAPLPLWVRFRTTDYLTRPQWALGLNWNQFPVAPMVELSRHMGIQIPERLKMSGAMDGAIVYSSDGLKGEVAFRDAALATPDSPTLRFEQARVVFDGGHARLAPALLKTDGGHEANLEADYDIAGRQFDLSIGAQEIPVEALRAQVALADVPFLEQVRSGSWTGRLHYHQDSTAAGWTGKLELANAEIAPPALASPVLLTSAQAQIDGPRVTLDRITGQAGKTRFSGSYRYEPGAPRPHRIRLHSPDADAADIEDLFLPTLRRGGLITRALGRAPAPEWLRELAVDGTIQIDNLTVAGRQFQDVRARMLWDLTRVEFDGLQARLEGAAITGRLNVDMRRVRPSYRLSAKLSGYHWQAGKIDAQGTVETFGTGAQLLSNLSSTGSFSGARLELGEAPVWQSVAGKYAVEWWQSAPHLRLTGLDIRTEDETFTGQGATQSDGKLVILLTGAGKEMRVSGTLAKLSIEEPDGAGPRIR